MQKFDLGTLSNNQRNTLNGFIANLIEFALADSDNEGEYHRIDAALNQQFTESAIKADVNDPNIAEVDPDDGDGIDEMHTPLIYKTQKGWVTHLKESCIPASADWFAIQRTYSKFFKDMGLLEFLPRVNDCWIRNIEIENDRFKIKQKIRKGITQYATYGHTPGVVYYDSQSHFVDVKVVHSRDYGIYPISDDWQKSSNIIRYPINYTDLMEREDLDQNIIKQLEPEINWNSEDYDRGSTPTERSSFYEEDRSPFGKLMLHDVWIPSLYIPEDGEAPELAASGIYLTIAYNPRLKANNRLEEVEEEKKQGNIFILKSSKNVKAEDLTLLFAAFDETLPGQQTGRGPLAPFLIYQEVQNCVIQNMTREITREGDPPVAVNGEEIDIEDADLPEFKHGAVYKGVNVTPITVDGLDGRMNNYYLWDRHLTDKVEEASGMDKRSLGARTSSKRTKYELQTQDENTGLRINDAADLFDEGFLRPFIVARIKQTQYQLKTQIENSVNYLLSADPSLMPDQAFEIAADSNELFKRLLNTTRIELEYDQFYEEYLTKQRKNEGYIEEYQTTMVRLAQAQDQLATPIPEFPRPPKGQYDDASVAAAEEEYYTVKRDEKTQLQEIVSNLTLELKAIQQSIENLPDIPAPSMMLYYELLIHEIDDSDIIVTGAKSSLNKSLMKNAIREVFEMLQNVDPETLKEMDYKKLIKQYFNSIGLSYEDMRKSQVELNRLERRLEQQQIQQQQMLQQGNA